MNHKLVAILACLVLIPLVSCSLSSTTSSSDPSQCTDRGWEEIGGFMRQFEALVSTLGEGTSFEAYLDGLTDLKDEISAVSIDPCAESARQKIVSGLEYKITGMDLSQDIENEVEAGAAFETGMDLVWEGLAELESLGISVDYP